MKEDKIECCDVLMSPLMHKWHMSHNHAFRYCPVCKEKIKTMSAILERPPYFFCSKECKVKVADRCPNCLTAPYDPLYSGRCEKCRKAFGQVMKFARQIKMDTRKER